MATTSRSDVKQKAIDAAHEAEGDIADGVNAVKSQVKATASRVRSEAADVEDTIRSGAEDLANTVTSRLRAAGLDTDHMVDVAREQASELQQLIEDEIRDRPLRALGLAAAVGLFVGFLAAR